MQPNLIFINLDDGGENTMSKFVDAAKLCKVVDTLEEGRAAIRRGLHLELSNTMQRSWMGPGRQQAEQKSAVCPCCKGGQLSADLYEQKWSQQIKDVISLALPHNGSVQLTEPDFAQWKDEQRWTWVAPWEIPN